MLTISFNFAKMELSNYMKIPSWKHHCIKFWTHLWLLLKMKPQIHNGKKCQRMSSTSCTKRSKIL